MAQYTNLTSLAGLKVGDVVIYNTETDIDLAGYRVKFEVIGVYKKSGYSCGTMSTKSHSSVTFNTTCSSCFYLKSSAISNWLYKRFIVAGNEGWTSDNWGGGNSYPGYYKYNGGAGGGLSGGEGSVSENSGGYYQGFGGTQSSGGSYKYKNSNAGSFGYGGKGYISRGSTSGKIYNTDGTTTTGQQTNDGGAGWYGGGGGYSSWTGYYSHCGGGGGSGYVLTEESYKPSGYMSDYDFILYDTTLTTGGAQEAYNTYGAYNIGIITIVETAFDPETQTKIVINVLGNEEEFIVDQGTILERPTTPTEEGYIFKDWYIDLDKTTKPTFGIPLTSDWVYLYAKMLRQQITKTFRNNEGNLVQCKFYRWNGSEFERVTITHLEDA